MTSRLFSYIKGVSYSSIVYPAVGVLLGQSFYRTGLVVAGLVCCGVASDLINRLAEGRISKYNIPFSLLFIVKPVRFLNPEIKKGFFSKLLIFISILLFVFIEVVSMFYILSGDFMFG